MKLEHRANLIARFLGDKGPQFSIDLCREFQVSEQVLLNTMKLLRQSGRVVVDQIRRKGERGAPKNRFRLASDEDGKDARVVIHTEAKVGQAASIFGKYNPADPFGLVAKSKATPETQDITMDFCCSMKPSGNLVILRAGSKQTEFERFEAKQLRQFLNAMNI